MIDPIASRLAGIRWETTTNSDFVGAVAEAVRPATRAKAVELGCPELGRLIVTFVPGHPTRVDERPFTARISEIVRRPRSGWAASDGVGREVGASQRTTVALQARRTEAHLVLWTARTSWDEGVLEELSGALGLLLDARLLVRRVATLSRTAHSDNRRLRRALRFDTDPTARSSAMRRCLERAHAVAPYDTPVLVSGPSGAGKERVARRIHAWSARRTGPFVALNCGALPDSLAESELFGHRRGAFTGASRDHRGVFERARGGTLLLDEVGELSPPAQVKLLRVLQEGSFTPLGAERSVSSDARVIAATHRDLSAAVGDGAFREDLYYRVAVFEVAVPALRDRAEDLPALVHEVLQSVATQMGRAAPSVPRRVMTMLAAHDWPGNVRELRNTLEGALVMTTRDELAAPLRSPARTIRPRAATDVPTFEEASRRAIEAALDRCAGKIYGADGAAAVLGLKPGTLQSKMRKLGVSRSTFLRRTSD